MHKSVLVAYSGGLDSSMTALLLKNKGYNVTCIHLNFFNIENNEYKLTSLNEFCKKIEVPLVIKFLENEFNASVIKYFTNEYTLGKTPCPCSFCNAHFKWKYLYDFAKENEFDFIATGHYVRTESIGPNWFIKRGLDRSKDQSFFLWKLNQDQISKTITPLGSYTKKDVKQMAKDLGYNNLAQKAESMGICFLQGEDYRNFLKEVSVEQNSTEGDVVDQNGNYIAKHNGIHNYTIGQKRGIMNLQKGLCVTKIDYKENKLVVGPWDNLFYNTLKLVDCNFTGLETGEHKGLEVMIRGFGKNPMGKAQLTLNNDNTAIIHLENHAWAPSPGQPTVVYKGDTLLGGGYLIDSYNKE